MESRRTRVTVPGAGDVRARASRAACRPAAPRRPTPSPSSRCVPRPSRLAPWHDPPSMAIALALAAAASWGLADFLAGLASRRVSVPIVLLLVEGGGLVVIT